ncbi:hypothetical protein GYMLUDRAFT_251841 [Collybiopsis luxurians FD-317 M1]|uniref:Uncharacterized protein n=1 Tax=Collybiopsis luxurians FD-317 M1 TaxID=944289 RepID=A0A0D0AN89_9AGAR|nr:hypothetical protein GYMLUDRAFT_251841 [Collybiopsis luxurians FD-317 M1]
MPPTEKFPIILDGDHKSPSLKQLHRSSSLAFAQHPRPLKANIRPALRPPNDENLHMVKLVLVEIWMGSLLYGSLWARALPLTICHFNSISEDAVATIHYEPENAEFFPAVKPICLQPVEKETSDATAKVTIFEPPVSTMETDDSNTSSDV